jgi:hypothetical protein
MKAWLLVLACLSSVSQAQVYTYTDAQGNRVYTDQPRKGATAVQVPQGNRLNQPNTRPSTAPNAPPPARPGTRAVTRVVHYEMFRILVPLPDASVTHASGEMIVTLTSEPALEDGHLYRVLLDGQPAAEPGTSPVIALHNVDRGTHQLAGEILDSQGNVLERTPPQPVHMKRTSLSQKRRVHPCKEADYGKRPECPLSDKPEDDD